MADTKFHFQKMLQNFEKLKQELPPVIANDGAKFFRQSFERGGFTDRVFERWTKSKKKAGATLVKTGNLRRKVNNSVKKATFKEILFSVDGLPYAQIHNEGGVIHKQERDTKLNFKIGKDGKSRFAKFKKANFQQDITIGAHDIIMPKRQYIGNSYVFIQSTKSKLIKALTTLRK